MGCTTSHDAFAAAVTSSSSSRARRASSSSRRPGPAAADPAALCRERVALIRAAADRRFALAAAHAAYFRSLAAVGGALRRFAAAALAPAAPGGGGGGGSSPVLRLPPSPAKRVAASASSLPPSPPSSSTTVSSLSHSLSDHDDVDVDEAPRLHDDAERGRGGGSDKAASSSSSSSTRRHHHHYMRRSSTVPTVVYEDDPNAQAHYTQYGYGYGYEYPYGPYGEVVAGERPAEPAPAPRPPPSPPIAEVSPWDFLDPFTHYDQFMEDHSRGNLPTNSPNYAEVRRMEGVPELEDEAEMEAKAAAAEASKPSTSGVAADQNAKGKGPIAADNAASKGKPSKEPEEPASGGKLQSKGSETAPAGAGKLQRKGSETAPAGAGKLQRKGSETAPDGSAGAGKPVSRNDNSVPSNASSKSRKGRKNAASLKGTSTGDIEGSSTDGKKKAVAFDEEQSIRGAEGGGGDSHGKSVHSVVSSEQFSPLHHGTRDVTEAMDEVKDLFDEAVNCSTEVSRLLEVGKMPPQSTPRVLRCGYLIQSSRSSRSCSVNIILPPKCTWLEVKSNKQQGEHFSFIKCWPPLFNSGEAVGLGKEALSGD